MDTKKKLFHLSNLANKKNKLQQQLINYKNNKNTYLSNFSSQQPYDNTIIINLQKQKNDLESIIKSYKESINQLSKNKSDLYIILKKLPNELQDKIKAEEIIYDEEIDRIKQTYIDLDTQLLQQSYTIYDLKENLSCHINNKIKELNIESTILNNIQLNAHSNRLDILQSLKQKKIDKHQHLDTIKQFHTNLDTINCKIDNFKKDKNELQLFKSTWIDAYYNNNQNLITIPSSINNVTIFNSLELNKQIEIIDNIINVLNKQILQHHNLSQKILLQLTDYNQSRQTKILENDLIINDKQYSFKDSYKLQKEKKQCLEEELKHLRCKHSNFEKESIEPIIVEYMNNVKQLEKDVDNANKRLDIMKIRLQDNYNNTNIEVKTQINNIDKELKEIKTIMDNIINEVGVINSDIKIYNDTYGIINDLDKKIIKVELEIKQIDEECKMIENN